MGKKVKLLDWLKKVLCFINNNKELGWREYIRYNVNQYIRYGWGGYLRNILWALEVCDIYVYDSEITKTKNELLREFENIPEVKFGMALGDGC